VTTSLAPNGQPQAALDHLTRVQALTAALSQAVTSEQVADAIIMQGMAVLGANAGCVAVLTDDRQELALLGIAGAVPDVAAKWHRFPVVAPVPLAEAVCGRTVVVVETLAERFTRYPALEGVVSPDQNGAMVALPMVVRDEVLGSLGWGWPTDRSFTDEDRAFLLTIAELCGQALDRARLYDTERAARERAERAEQALRESEGRFARFMHHLPGLAWIKDEQGRYVFANDAAVNAFGTPREQLCGKTDGEVFPPETAAQFREHDRQALAGGTGVRVIETLEHGDGVLHHSLVSKFPIPGTDGGAALVGGMAIDVTEDRRTRAVLEESEERFRATFEQAAVGIAHVGLDGRWLRVNRKLCDIVGYHPDELMRLTFQDITHPDDLEADLAQVRRLLAGAIQTYSMEKRYFRKDGSVVWINLTVALVRTPEGQPKYFISVVEDITEDQRVREALRESESRLRTLSDNLPLGAVYQGVIEADGRRRLTYVSAGIEGLLGVTPAEALADANAVYCLVHAEDRARVAAAEEAAFRTLTPFDCEFRSWTRSGGLIWVHARSAARRLPTGPLVWEGIVMDVTARREAEEALHRERELLGTIIDRIPVMLTVYEPDTRVLRLNPAFERAVGWSARDAAGVSLMEQCYPDPAHRERVRQFMQSCRDGWLDICMRTRDGRDLETSWANVRLSDGTQVGIGIDITDRRRYEESLRDADRRKDEFLATLAHELRNPLAPIRNGLQLIKLAGNKSEAVEQARGMMERQLTQMVRLIDDLLDVSRITRGRLQLRRERVELASVVQSAVEGSRPLMEASAHDLTIRLPPEPVLLDADPTRLAQVFANLLTNAAKYTEKGGRIWLTAERGAGEIAVSVKDTGIGIAAEHLPRLFEMFSQVKSALERSQGGLGIGLSLVKGLVEMHGGSVEARSEGHGKGSEFIVRLPLAGGTAGPENRQSVSGEGVAARPGRRILVADDNRDTADSLAMMLRLEGHEVHAVHDGQEAVEAAGWFRPDVALLDIGMPRMNGLEACRHIREQPWGKNMVLVAITGWGQEEDKRRATEAGFNHHLTKPADLAALNTLLFQVTSHAGPLGMTGQTSED
jgi:PAS domain S-box-containing protein